MSNNAGPNWDDRFRSADYLYGTKPNDFLAAVAERIPMGRVLMLAEGEGRNAVFLAGRGYEVTAVDNSRVGLNKAMLLSARRGVTITTILADLGEFDLGTAEWDGIVSCYCHLPPELRTPLHHAVVRALKPGGVLVLEGFSKEQLAFSTGGPKSPELLMRLEDLKDEFTGLEFLHAVEIEREVKEGSGHTGLAAVVQILAVKGQRTQL